VPGKSHPAGAKRDIMKGGGLGEEKPPERQERKVGDMPEVAQTFTRYDASYPFMNEKGVIIGETTIGGRRDSTTTKGLMDIMELERIALETRVHGPRSDPRHGRDGGEVRLRRQRRVPHRRRRQGSLAVRDLRAGPGRAGASGPPSGSRRARSRLANRSRITTLTDDPNFTMYSKNVYTVAESMGWWKKGDPSSSTASSACRARRHRTAASGAC